jgi:ComF family protein
MGTLMAALAHRAGLAGSHLIVPVPSLPRRHLERGYNPAALLATHVGRCLGVPVRFGALKRVRDTASRDRLDRKTRFARVREAYRAGKALDIQGRSILLVDDVLTTGATAEACSRVLMEAGAAAVDVLVFAGAIPRGRPNPLSDQP